MKKKIFIILAFLTLSANFSFAGLKFNFTGTGNTSADTAISNYLTQFTSTFDPILQSSAESFTLTNVTQPVFGEPYRNFVVGASLGIAAAPKISFDKSKPGGEILDSLNTSVPLFGDVNPASLGGAIAPFITISLDPLAGIFGLNFFKDTDFTFKVFSLNIGKDSNDVKVKFFNIGFILRKRILGKSKLIPFIFSFEGISGSLGVFYSKNKLSFNTGINHSETVDTVTFSANQFTGSLETKSLTLDTEWKAYFNFLEFMDIFGGGGVSLNLENKVDVNTQITGTISSGGFNSTNGASIYGETNGRTFVPRILVGLQANFWVLKFAGQYSLAFAEEKVMNISFTTALSF